VKSKLPSGEKVSRRKKEVIVSLWYRLVFLTARPMAALRLGEEISGRTAGNGREGAGEADRRNEGDEPKDDRLLDAMIGGSIGRGVVKGVPGLEGAGEAMAKLFWLAFEARWAISVGAGLLEEIRRPGRSILLNLPCVDKVGVPSFSFRA
jgi:hypothetical protein